MTTATELKTQILSKAAEDGDFRTRLLTDPRAAISAETGVTIPEGFNVAVHEDSATTAHLVLPPSPALTEAEMESVAGGGSHKGYYW
jgi:hypothetical protein